MQAGLPDGVLNIVHTTREDAALRVPEMIAHPAVRKIAVRDTNPNRLTSSDDFLASSLAVLELALWLRLRLPSI